MRYAALVLLLSALLPSLAYGGDCRTVIGGRAEVHEVLLEGAMPAVPADDPVALVLPTWDGPTEVHVLPYMPPPRAGNKATPGQPQGFIRIRSKHSTGLDVDEDENAYVAVLNERGEIKWHAVVTVPRQRDRSGFTRGVTMGDLAGVGETSKDYVQAEEIEGVEGTNSYMVFIRTSEHGAEVRGFSRSADGFLTDLGKSGRALTPRGAQYKYAVGGNPYTPSGDSILLNPASNRKTVGLLRLANPCDGTATVDVRVEDDEGIEQWTGEAGPPPAGTAPVSCRIPPRQSILIDVRDLENEAEDLQGTLRDRTRGMCSGEGFGDGDRKWGRVAVLSTNRAERAIFVQAFLRSSAGVLSNMSR